jgi:subtilase family serine protease
MAGLVVALATVSVAIPLSSPPSAGASTNPGGSTSVVSGAAQAGPGVSELGPSPAKAPLQLDVGLKLPDPAALSAFIASVSDPTSPDYRQYLAPGRFGPMFGPTASTVDAVRAALRQSGLKVGALYDGMLLPVTTNVAGAQKAFGVTMRSFRLPSGKVVNANVTAAQLPSSIASFVSGVTGLDNLVQLTPLGLAAASPSGSASSASSGGLAPGQPAACSAGSGNWDADDIAQAYDFGPLYEAGDFGQGQTVALFENSGYSTSNVATYQTCYGTSVPIQIEPTSATNGTPSSEADDDIEDVVGLAPDITKVLVYEVQSTYVTTYAEIANDDLAQAVSSSWGTCEANSGSNPTLEEPIFAQMAAQGQSMFAASGDEGSEACNGTGSEPPFNDSLTVGDPAGQPFVTGVGGTALTALGDLPTTPPTETVWNSTIGEGSAFAGPPHGLPTAPGAGNGGISSDWTMPAYQKGSGVISGYSSSTPCSGASAPTTTYPLSSSGDCREVPDVSANAGESYTFFTGTPGAWSGWLGTSISSPDWAAMTALINASTSTTECNTPAPSASSAGFLNPALYQLATSTPSDFNDITATGNNDMTGTNSGAYPTTTGYDMATGLGSPVAADLAQSLCPRTPILVTVSGSQGYGSSSPTFSQTNNAPGAVTVSGTLSCPTVNGGTAISAALAAGSYTIDAAQCTGITDSEPLSYVIEYTGSPGDFTVGKDSTSTSLTVNPGSEPYGQESSASFTVAVSTGNGEELPETDDVDVDVGSTTVCIAHVAPAAGGGSGSCSPTSETIVDAGSYTATADYAGDSDLTGSDSSTAFAVTLVLTSPPLPNPTWEMPYSTTITATGAAPGPVTFSEVGALPTGLGLSSSGTLSGIPTGKSQIGESFPFVVTANGPNSATGSQSYSITLESPCGSGLTPYFLTASSNTGDFLGLFCTNSAGTGTYTQYSTSYVVQVKGTGSVTTSGSTTRVSAYGTDLALLGEENPWFSTFTETAPAPEKAGTFTLV